MAEMGRNPGERSAVKSNFAVACSLLSQYVKEKGRIADLGLGMAPRPQESAIGKAETFRRPTTMSFLTGARSRETMGDDDDDDVSRGNAMDLFPQRAGFGDVARNTPVVREPEKAQLTIFYGGKVLVFDNFPAEKTKDLMQMAGKGSSNAQNFGYVPLTTTTTTGLAQPNGICTPAIANPSIVDLIHAQKPAQPYVSDVPIARRASLHRFLEKRKNRINAKAPYQVNGSSEMVAHIKKEDSQPWLGLGPQISMPGLSLMSEWTR